jgi:hypothetical protein
MNIGRPSPRRVHDWRGRGYIDIDQEQDSNEEPERVVLTMLESRPLPTEDVEEAEEVLETGRRNPPRKPTPCQCSAIFLSLL